MEAKLELKAHSVKLSQKQIDAEVVQHFNVSHKDMLRMLNEKALDRAFQLYTARA
ncbi:hypothetical protein Q4493_01465 [Colwellia sp. 1_MG-2023]|uniref:hypothetical protein n=1 Tax=Colwellia sp. 1_MG-2023 TaxID=3062649 RepID=UPI0026E41791|nr:hypothetical protein [Colwellia sp. 1_MG-2023]MDO6444433.1 hypothetical protein [Colwellia sp. 1_MG-2023]